MPNRPVTAQAPPGFGDSFCNQCPSVTGYFHRHWAQILLLEIRQCIPAVKIIACLEFARNISPYLLW